MNEKGNKYIEETQIHFLLFESAIQTLNDNIFWEKKSQTTEADIIHTLKIRSRKNNTSSIQKFSKQTLRENIINKEDISEKDNYISNYIMHSEYSGLIFEVLNFYSTSKIQKIDTFFWYMGNTLESINKNIEILINIENKKESLSPIKIEDYLNIVQSDNLKKFNFTILIKKLKEKSFSEKILEKLNTHYKNKKDFLIENLININKLDDFKDNSFSINDQSYCCLFWITEKWTLYIDIKKYNEYIRHDVEKDRCQYNYKSLFILKKSEILQDK